MNMRLIPPLWILLITINANASWATEKKKEIWIVTGPKTTEIPLTVVALKELYLGQPLSISYPIDLKVLDRKSGPDDLRDKFYTSVVEKTAIQIKAYWSQLIFTGRGYPPPAADSVEDIKKILGSTPGVITYIDPSEVDPSFRVLLKIKKGD